MPTYVYRCKKCGETFERLENISDHESAAKTCPKCDTRDVESVPAPFFAKTASKS